MDNRKTIKEIKGELKILSTYEVVLFGSYVEGSFRIDSDIDIAIITRKSDEKYNIKVLKQLLGKILDIYELHIFELLPIHIKMSVINTFEVIYGDKIELSEYFYEFRKVWDDCKYRILGNQFDSYKEKMVLMKNRTEI